MRAFFSRNPLHWVGAALAFGAVAAGIGALVAAAGVINLSAVPPHPDGWAHLLHYGMTRSVAHHAGEPPGHEPLDSTALVMAGAASYAVICENCHGAPGSGQSSVALSMRPEPPELTEASAHYSDKELFFIIQNGVRYSGMPAWSVQNRPEEIWALVAFLKAAPKLTRESYSALAHGDPKELTLARATPAPNATDGISAFIPSTREKPYLPGDPQEAFASPNATMLPRRGYRNIAAGDSPLTACVSCHSSDGAGRAGGLFPNLTLQSPQYIYDALHAFASGQRQSGVMWAIAGTLSDQDMRTLAVQLGSGPPLRSRDASPGLNPDEKQRGADIVAQGTGSDAGAPEVVPPEARPGAVERCSSCHFPQVYLGKLVPNLDGQYASYLRMQMYAFRSGGRGDTSSYNPMVADAHHLSDADIEALAKLYASRAPLAKQK